MTLENPHAGQGPVLLDIGGDVGALVVTMPVDTAGLEVEIRPVGATAGGRHHHTHDHGHSHTHSHRPYPHVGVVARPADGRILHSLVYPSVRAGDYELCPIPGDVVAMTVTVVGGEVTELQWPHRPDAAR